MRTLDFTIGKAKNDKYKHINTIVNKFSDGKIEVLRYSELIQVMKKGADFDSSIDRSRCFAKIVDDKLGEILIPLKDNSTLSKFTTNQIKCSNRATDRFYGYGYCNLWDYFFTFTVSPKYCNRHNDSEVKNIWALTRKRLQYYDNDVRLLTAPERHQDMSLHFHTLAGFTNPLPIVYFSAEDMDKYSRTCEKGKNKGKHGFCTYDKNGAFTKLPDTNYSNYLVPYYEYGELQKSAKGYILYCYTGYKYGRCSCAILPTDIVDQTRVVNYCILYTTKECNIGYLNRRFYHTNNIAFKDKEVRDISSKCFKYLVEEYNLVKFKEFDKSGNLVEVYRNFNLRESTEEDKNNQKERLSR